LATPVVAIVVDIVLSALLQPETAIEIVADESAEIESTVTVKSPADIEPVTPAEDEEHV